MPPTPPIKSSIVSNYFLIFKGTPIPPGQPNIPAKGTIEPPKSTVLQENDIISRQKLQLLVNQITANTNSTLDTDVQEVIFSLFLNTNADSVRCCR